MTQTKKILDKTGLSLQKSSEQSVAQTKREELMVAFNPKDPSEEIVIDMIASAYAQWKEIDTCRLGATTSLFGFEAEARVKQLAARHVKEMIFALRELQRAPSPPIQVKNAKQIQIAVLQKDV